MKRVLAIDGGGIRGIIPAIILSRLEKRVGQISKNFDLIAGTSTGAILALGLTKPSTFGYQDLSASDMIGLYEDHGKTIFETGFFGRIKSIFSSKYRHDGISSILEKYLYDFRLSQALTNVMVTSYDTERGRPVIFKSWKKDHENILAVDAAIASSSAPTYFPPKKIRDMCLIDGGMVANNPAMCAYAEAKKLWPDKEIQVLSLSTGGENPRIGYEQVKKMGLLNWAPKIVDVVMDGALDIVDYQLKEILGKNYLRVKAKELDVALDDYSYEAMTEMKHCADSISMIPVMNFVAIGSNNFG